MATEIPVVKFGSAPSFIAAESELEYVNDGRTLVHILNNSGGNVIVTHVEQVQCEFEHDLTDADDTAPTGSTTQIWRGWQIRRFTDRTTRKATIELDVTSSVQVAAVSYS